MRIFRRNLMSRREERKLHSSRTDELLSRKLFLQREYSVYHLEYEKERAFYDAVGRGDFGTVKRLMLPLRNGLLGQLSPNPLRNLKYHLVVSIAMITRACIEGGLNPEAAYTLSDIYVQQTDRCATEEGIDLLHREMIFDFTSRMADKDGLRGLSQKIVRAVDYIYDHLQEKISVSSMAEFLGMGKTYLCDLFRRETGITVGAYIRKKKIEAAQKLILYDSCTSAHAAAFLGFSSASHFIRIFQQEMGCTPGEYKKIRLRGRLAK